MSAGRLYALETLARAEALLNGPDEDDDPEPVQADDAPDAGDPMDDLVGPEPEGEPWAV